MSGPVQAGITVTAIGWFTNRVVDVKRLRLVLRVQPDVCLQPFSFSVHRLEKSITTPHVLAVHGVSRCLQRGKKCICKVRRPSHLFCPVSVSAVQTFKH